MGSFILDSLPTLTEVDIMYGSFTSAKWLIPLIADASLSCGLKEDVTKDQLQFTAMAIFSRYRWLKASEVMLFFFNFKAGFYERFYSYFDTQTIIRSVKTFIEERTLAIAAHERNMQGANIAKHHVCELKAEMLPFLVIALMAFSTSCKLIINLFLQKYEIFMRYMLILVFF